MAKRRGIASALKRQFGGDWSYDGVNTWNQVGTETAVMRHPTTAERPKPEYWLYQTNEAPRKIEVRQGEDSVDTGVELG